LYVTDAHNHRVQILTASGVFITEFPVRFLSCVAVDSYGRIFVGDNHSVYLFGFDV